jgi:hypothetical protein
VQNAPLGLVKVTKDKLLVRNAVPVNSTTFSVLLLVNRVLKTRITAAKEETLRVSIAPSGGRPKAAVPNVSRAGRGGLVLDAKFARWVLPETATTKMPPNANNVHWGKQQRLKVPRLVINVILVNLATQRAFAKIARLGFIKIPKERKHAAIPVTPSKKYPTTRVPGVNCHRGVLAKWANI